MKLGGRSSAEIIYLTFSKTHFGCHANDRMDWDEQETRTSRRRGEGGDQSRGLTFAGLLNLNETGVEDDPESRFGVDN